MTSLSSDLKPFLYTTALQEVHGENVRCVNMAHPNLGIFMCEFDLQKGHVIDVC